MHGHIAIHVSPWLLVLVVVGVIAIPVAVFWFADWYRSAQLDAMTLHAIDEAHERRLHSDIAREELPPDSEAGDGLRG